MSEPIMSYPMPTATIMVEADPLALGVVKAALVLANSQPQALSPQARIALQAAADIVQSWIESV
jgi:hypothetical protein